MLKNNKAVVRNVIALSLPIAVQNVFSTAVSSADVLMVGMIGQDSLSAVSLAGQVTFVLNLILLGLTIGTSLIVAQYFGKAYKCVFNNGILSAGGDTGFGLICDTIDMWCNSVPLGFTAAFVLHLPPMVVYLLISTDELVKLSVYYLRYRQGKWIQNITKEGAA